MDERQLSALVAVADLGSIGAAARASYLTQPAMSRTLTSLEREIGVRLLDRSRDGAALTPAGRVVVPLAQEVLRLMAAARQPVPRGGACPDPGVAGRQDQGQPTEPGSTTFSSGRVSSAPGR